MGKNLTHKDMVDIISMRTGKSENTVKQVYNNILDIIATELKNNSYIRLKNFGEIRLEQKGGADEIFLNQFGLQEKRYVEPYYVLDLSANKNLLDYINGDIDRFVRNDKGHKKQNKSKDDAYAEYLDKDSTSNFDSYLLTLTKKRRENTDYINAWSKGEIETDPTRIKNCKKIYCASTGVIYDSIRSAAMDLHLSESKLYKRLKRGKTDCDGYEFEIIDNR